MASLAVRVCSSGAVCDALARGNDRKRNALSVVAVAPGRPVAANQALVVAELTNCCAIVGFRSSKHETNHFRRYSRGRGTLLHMRLRKYNACI